MLVSQAGSVSQTLGEEAIYQAQIKVKQPSGVINVTLHQILKHKVTQ